MEIISDLSDHIIPWGRCVLTLGDFDGIHSGHRRLIQRAIAKGVEKNLPVVLLTYQPSPKKVLYDLKDYSEIYTKEEKIILLRKYPLQTVIFLTFNKETARLSAKRFLTEILLEKLRAGVIVIGHDHRFGRHRHGHYSYLKLASVKYGIEVEKIKPVRLFREIASSTWIRNLIREGDITKANRLLELPYMMQGRVVEGKKRGKKLGIPTANLVVPNEKLIPREGVYACMVRRQNVLLRSVTNIGYNPTFRNKDLSIEVHILDFDRNIYGEKLTLYFIERLRDEKKFQSVGDLQKQIARDIQRVEGMPIPDLTG